MKTNTFHHFLRGARLAVMLFLLPWPLTSGALELPFGSQSDIATSANGVNGPVDVVSGDITNNGKTDLVMCTQTSGQIWKIYNGGTAVTLATGLDSPRSIDLGDIDRDGDLDLILGQYHNIDAGGQAEIIWYENLSNGQWTAHDAYSLSYTGVRSIKLADIDADGDLDYVLAAEGDPDQSYSSLSWRENMLSDTGTAEFSGNHHNLGASPERPWAVEVADFDGDGDLDIAAIDIGLDTLSWYENDGTPISGWTEHTIDASLDGAISLAIGDVNRDGLPDVIASASVDDTISWYEMGSPSWTEHSIATGLNFPSSVEPGDLDFDGDLDLVVSRQLNDEILWIENMENSGGSWQLHSIDTSFSGAYDALPVDLDADGDLDVAAIGYTADRLSWWENTGIHRSFTGADPVTIIENLDNPRGIATADINGDGLKDVVLGGWGDAWVKVYLQVNETSWWENTVETGITQFRDMAVGDIDHDGDLDILGASVADDKIFWWANDGGALPSWTKHTVVSSFNGAHAVEVADMDADGDLDLVVGAIYDDEVRVLINANGVGTTWSTDMTNSIDGTYDIVIGDLNSDGQPDVVASAYYGDFIRIMLQAGTAWSPAFTITGLNGPRGIDLGDIDGDGDLDIVGAIRNDNDILWFENDGNGGGWTSHDVGAGYLSDGSSVQAVDMDHDGDIDVIGTSYEDDEIIAWENGGDGSSWQSWYIDTDIDSPWQALVDDLNGDNNPDIILSAAGTTDSLTWYKNIGGQFSATPLIYLSELMIGDGERRAVLEFIIDNYGRSGDHDLEVSRLKLYFEDTEGNPLSPTEANNIIDRMEIYADSDGDNHWTEGVDTLVTTDFYLSLSGGFLSLSIPHGLSGNSVEPTTGLYYFIVFKASSDASVQDPREIQLTFRTNQLECSDLSCGLALIGEAGRDAQTGTITLGSMLFGDDFESGDLSAWSTAVSP